MNRSVYFYVFLAVGCLMASSPVYAIVHIRHAKVASRLKVNNNVGGSSDDKLKGCWHHQSHDNSCWAASGEILVCITRLLGGKMAAVTEANIIAQTTDQVEIGKQGTAPEINLGIKKQVHDKKKYKAKILTPPWDTDDNKKPDYAFFRNKLADTPGRAVLSNFVSGGAHQITVVGYDDNGEKLRVIDSAKSDSTAGLYWVDYADIKGHINSALVMSPCVYDGDCPE